MDRLSKFNEFLEKKAKVALMADYTAKTPAKPPANGKYPDQPKNTGVSGAQPYHAPGATKDKGLVMAEPDGKPPLAHGSTPGLTPEKSAALGQKPAARPAVQKHSTSRKALKEFVEATKGLGDAEFIQYLMEGKKERMPVQPVHDLHGEAFTPHPHEAIGYICSLMHNPKMVSRLVREAKRHGHLDSLVQELMDHPEFYDEAVKMMGDRDGGRKVTDKFARTMFDHHSKFRKDAGFNEAYQRRRRLLTEKVSGSLVDGGDDDGEDAGIPQPDDSPNGGNPLGRHDGEEETPGMDPSADDQGPMDANGQPADGADGLGDDMGGGNAGLTPAHGNMLGSLHGQFGNDAISQYCKDGNC